MKWMTLFLALMMGVTAGCASGGFKLTRQYARFVNSQNIVIRIVLYILTSIVFAVTMLVDMVIFNTIDFWNGTVSQGDYNFKDGEKTFYVKHEVLPGSQLKRSTIKVTDSDGKQLQEVILAETTSGEIDLVVDGMLRARVRDIQSLPVVSLFNEKGLFLGENIISNTLSLTRYAVPPEGRRL